MERKSLFTRQNANVVRSQTFAMTVESYDTAQKPHVVRGKRLDNGDEVVVSLREIDFQQRGKYKRSEIADFAAPRKDRQHPGTTPGGTLLVQDAQQLGEGHFGARWIQSLSHTEGEAEVFHTTIHVTPVKQSADKKRDYSMMTMLHDGDFSHLSEEMMEKLKITPPFKIDSVDELKDALTTLLDEGTGVGVRVSNSEGFDAMYVSRKKGVSAKDAVDTFMGNIKDMADAINAGELTCEVVPYGNVWAGPATTEIMLKNAVVQSRLARFNDMATGKNGSTYPVAIFRPAIVAVRFTPADEHGNIAVFFSHFEPLFTRQPVNGLVNAIAYARSEHLSPEVPKPEPKQGAAAPSNSTPDRAESGFGSFDGADDLPASDDPLMDAAGGGASHDIGDDHAAAPAPAPAPAAEPEQRARRYGRRA